ncbi:YppG family protein [Jeotgalibacillus proteolyticus]|uniref:YppG family protein n=1 Tax=Jeotgalibacillus proteolyticus TaxID=2082395 RepID=UPI003CEB4C4B
MYRTYYQRYPVHPPIPGNFPVPYGRPIVPSSGQLYPGPASWGYSQLPLPIQRPVSMPLQPQQTAIPVPQQPLQPEPYIQDPYNPYAQQQKPQSSWFEIFKTEKGHVDVNKVMSTAGQMMSTAQQFGSLVKGIGSIFPKV